jgi:Xaa-Pro aminopeptidase
MGGEETHADRIQRLTDDLRTREVDALLVSAPLGVRYLTGFTGTHGLVLVAAEPPAAHRFFTDFRYATQSAEQVSATFAREIVAGELLEAAVSSLDAAGGRLGFDDASVTVAQHARLRELLQDRWELVPCAGAVERLRAVKDGEEIARIRAASELADEALRAVLEDGVVGLTERDVAIALELRMRRLGAEAASFPSIVAAGAHGALPHAEPRDEPIPGDVLVTIDWGARHEGYCSDCTRTYATGEHIPDEASRIYELVLDAQRQGVVVVTAGLNGKEIDAVARAVIEQGGHGEHFGHGLGHGVGMEVHEGPRLSRTAGEEPLQVGNVVTVEPGVYLPDVCGVRIEDLLVVTEQGSDILTALPKELTVVS